MTWIPLIKLTSTSSHARPRTSDSSAIFMTFPVVTTIRRQHFWLCQGTQISTVSGMDFRIYLYPTILWYKLLRYWYSLMNWDALFNDCVVFHVGHAVGDFTVSIARLRKSFLRHVLQIQNKSRYGRQRCEKTYEPQHTIDLGNPKPVQDIRHESLKSHVFDSGNIFCPLKILACPVRATFPCVVHFP